MKFYKITNPKDYALCFYKQIGLKCSFENKFEQIWQAPNIGEIHVCGSIDEIQFGIGDYIIPSDLMSEVDYESEFLHFGIIYEGVTYSLVDKKLMPMSHPSAFLAIEKSIRGINCWKKGQRFRGIEVSVQMEYLQDQLLKFLGYNIDALDFIRPNVRYNSLSKELKETLLKIEMLLKQRRMTPVLQKALCMEFLAYLLSGKAKSFSTSDNDSGTRYIHIGKRMIKITQDDIEKIVKVHDKIERNAGSFISVYELSQEYRISEQKLRVGFSELYQQTIWNYAHNLRMNKAARLLCNTDYTINEVAFEIGYQSPAAFANMFKSWCGLTPGHFRKQLSEGT